MVTLKAKKNSSSSIHPLWSCTFGNSITQKKSFSFFLKWEGKHITRSKLTIRCVPPQNVIRLFSVDRYLPAPRRYLKLGGARDSYALGRAMGELHQSPGPQSFGFEVDNTMLSLRCFFFMDGSTMENLRVL